MELARAHARQIDHFQQKEKASSAEILVLRAEVFRLRQRLTRQKEMLPSDSNINAAPNVPANVPATVPVTVPAIPTTAVPIAAPAPQLPPLESLLADFNKLVNKCVSPTADLLNKYVNPDQWVMTTRKDRNNSIWEHPELPGTEWIINRHWAEWPRYLTSEPKIRVYPTRINDALKANTVGMANDNMMALEEATKLKFKAIAKAKHVGKNKAGKTKAKEPKGEAKGGKGNGGGGRGGRGQPRGRVSIPIRSGNQFAPLGDYDTNTGDDAAGNDDADGGAAGNGGADGGAVDGAVDGAGGADGVA